MFERFTERARRVIVLAQEEARGLNHAYIGTEHLLLGLVRETDGLAAQALAAKGVALDRARAEISTMAAPGATPPHGHIPFTPRAKKTLELALREAVRRGHNFIGTEHILLGLLEEGEGVACQALSRLGVAGGDLREYLFHAMSADPQRVGALVPWTRPSSSVPPAQVAQIVTAFLEGFQTRLEQIEARLERIEKRLGEPPAATG